MDDSSLYCVHNHRRHNFLCCDYGCRTKKRETLRQEGTIKRSILNNRTYLETPFALRVVEIDSILRLSIPIAFQREKPNDENDLNDKIQALLCTSENRFSREYPIIEFGLTAYRADHAEGSLLIESKYIREKTTPNVAAKEIAVDIVEIPDRYGVMFVVYDPYRSIPDDEKYIKAFEEKRKNCFVKVYR